MTHNDEFLNDSEKLYRAILPRKAFWDFENNKRTSGAFKDKNGLSVDRQAERNNDEAVKKLLSSKSSESIIVSINIKECKEIPVTPIYKPSKKNIYHSEIHDSTELIQISKKHARKIAEKVKIENIDSIG